MTPQEAFNHVWAVNKSPNPHLEPIIAQDRRVATMYATLILCPTRFTLAEPIIMEKPESAVQYAMAVIRGPWPEAEPTIMKCASSSLVYAIHVLKRRWWPCEPAILASKDVGIRNRYLTEWPHVRDEWVALGLVDCLDLTYDCLDLTYD